MFIKSNASPVLIEQQDGQQFGSAGLPMHERIAQQIQVKSEGFHFHMTLTAFGA